MKARRGTSGSYNGQSTASEHHREAAMGRRERWSKAIRHGVLVAGIGLGGLVALLARTGGAAAAPAPQAQATRPGGGTVTPGDGWPEVDRLAGDQRLEAAAKLAGELRAAAEQAGDAAGWTRGLVTEVQLRIALHGYETAVRFLKQQPWPSDARSQAVLSLFYGRSLVAYLQAYSWEIGQREKVESAQPVDLQSWTKAEIVEHALDAYADVWARREALGAEKVSELGPYLEPNTYPRGIRDTLRDAVSYLFAEVLTDTSLWSPEESADLYRLDLAALIKGSGDTGVAALRDPAVHPLVKACAVLADLESWHRGRSEREAALEAFLERSRRLWAAFSAAAERDAIRAALAARLEGERPVAWWSMGMSLLAEMTRDGRGADRLARARTRALEGATAYPGSVGAERCRAIVAAIEQPDFSIATMASDGAGKRSLQVTHKNLPRVELAAYAVDLAERVGTARDYNLLPAWREVEEIIAARRPVATWTVDLPPTPDFEAHRTFVTPPLATPGLYVITAGATSAAAADGRRRMAVDFVLTDLVLLNRRDSDGSVTVNVLSGASGKPVAGAQVSLYRYDWQRGHRQVASRVSGDDGEVHFPFSPDLKGAPLFLLARHGADVALDQSGLWLAQQAEQRDTSAALVFTDRSVYRPEQTLYWKVVAYRGGRAARYHVLPGAAVTVTLHDGNGDEVASLAVTTNDYGSAAGEFAIPAGRILGGWAVRSSLGGAASVRVEEYKRPTFEASFKDPVAPLRLNRPATLTGEARYYFGLPVVTGTVRWRVQRESEYPWWWGFYWWRPAPAGGAQTVAAGSSELQPDGSFNVAFTPAADERKAESESGVTYRYTVAADVTDEGGETRSATRTFRLGFVAVAARIELDAGFVRERTTATATVHRTDLDGTPLPGAGAWTLLELVQPADAALPADVPLPASDDPAAYQTPGDRLRPRWDTRYSAEGAMRDWKDGAGVGGGTLSHDQAGVAKILLKDLPPGAYRLRYETRDAYGETCAVAQEIVVAAPHMELALPAVLLLERATVKVGETARLFLHTGLADQPVLLDVYRAGELVERRRLSSRDGGVIELPVGEADRGGFVARALLERDHQLIQIDRTVAVPWDNKELSLSFSTFRDRIRPGARETWRVTVKDPAGRPVEAGGAELLAYMYDRSLDLFAPHTPPRLLSLYPTRTWFPASGSSLGQASPVWNAGSFPPLPPYPSLVGDRLRFLDSYGIGGPGARGPMMFKSARGEMAPQPAPMLAASVAEEKAGVNAAGGVAQADHAVMAESPPPPSTAAAELRSQFAETAFWRPQLLTGADGSVAIEFTVPDSVTSWNVWAHAFTRDLLAGSVHAETRSVKELMVRPYLPRFLREGDLADLKVVVNNASEAPLSGTLRLDVVDPDSGASVLGEFGVSAAAAVRAFTVPAGGGTDLTFAVRAPRRVGTVAFKVVATAGQYSDGELRPLPLLPGRMHLAQSRFVALREGERRTMTFADLAAGGDPTLVNDSLVVTVDAQLFYSALAALPYLAQYPYECTEQTLNRFLSTGILTSLYGKYPAVARMAKQLSARATPLERFDRPDPNRRMALEETPWLVEARGGDTGDNVMLDVLDPRVATAQRADALAKLAKAQTASGGFPWWAGGPPSPYITLYIMYGLAKAGEFGVEVPRAMVQQGWVYLARHFRDEYVAHMVKDDCCWEFLTFMDYVASCYADPAWMRDALTAAERKQILDFSFKHWREHSPYLKSMLALTLARAGRQADAKLVFDSVMDAARTTRDEGTFWAAEDRSWLWYNDTIETHAFALRTLVELQPSDPRRDGLVQWLLLNKKLNHWKSTRATAEVLYALTRVLEAEGALAVRETVDVTVGDRRGHFDFEPDAYTGKAAQMVVGGPDIDPRTSATIVVEKSGKGLAFASATWNFSTEKLPEQERGDFFGVSRRYFRRESTAKGFVLTPLAEGAVVAVGDEIEVQLSLRTRHEAEYVHLRDPRPAGCEPVSLRSDFRWSLGIGYYEEVRDSGTNFFFEQLPVGEYPFSYRLRAAVGGTFKVAPATVQSMYAPEFNAYSAGATLKIGEGAATPAP
jgi:alpha-2-macroglobulin